MTTSTIPDVPLGETPVTNDVSPLVPAVPLFDVSKFNPPLLAASLLPETIETPPPVSVDAIPA